MAHFPFVEWPEGARFAFTILDDTDRTTADNAREAYSLLDELDMRTTKTVWPIRGVAAPRIGGATCEEPDYLEWVRQLMCSGFEIAFHNATYVSSTRAETERALERFRCLFGRYPKVHANHAQNKDGLYWGPARLSNGHRALYRLLTRNRTARRDGGSTPESAYFWGDLAQAHVTYVRNFVFSDINTLKLCPFMPYHDPERPFVNYWFASSEGANRHSFCHTIREENQDRLEEEGGACIMYTHFGSSTFRERGRVHPRVVELLKRLASKKGWFAPVGEVLDYLRAQRSDHVITDQQRRRLERRWLSEKVFITRGTS